MPSTDIRLRGLTEIEHDAVRVAAARKKMSMTQYALAAVREALARDANAQNPEGATMYAVYQSGYNVFGTGYNAQAAIADARQWIEGDAEVETPRTCIGGETIGNLYVRPCTARLAQAVRERGGDVTYEINDSGALDLAN